MEVVELGDMKIPSVAYNFNTESVFEELRALS